MNETELDPVFASALRDALVAHVEGTAQHRRRWRWRLALGLLTGTGVLAGGVAVAATLLSAPGGTVNIPLGSPVAVTRTGTATVALGSPPKGTSGISWALTCLSAGSFTFTGPGGASVTCSAGSHSSDVQPLRPGQTSITVATGPSISWKLRAEYVKTVATPFGVNAKGETYGVPEDLNGTPDLQEAPLSAGVPGGYLTTKQLDCASGGDVSNPTQAVAWNTFRQHTNTVIPVYKSDGTTVIGSYVVGPTGPGVQTVPLSTIAKRFCTSTRTPSTTVTLPRVVGEPEAMAASAIKALGLESQTTYASSSAVSQGDVIAETPSPGAKVPIGTLVLLTVSTGPPTGS
jgi:hypothetical protein